jgi:formylglycine-generating enzyme required for sulfatase activity
MDTNPSFASSCGDTCPVEQVSWQDIQTFLQRLNAKTAGVTYRLPTEAEWEYAARAGTNSELYGPLDSIAWYNLNSNRKPHPAAGKQANAWGLFDMLGNVSERVSDWFAGNYYALSIPTDPEGPTTGASRVLRGGSWNFGVTLLRAAVRSEAGAGLTSGGIGFRLVRIQ